MKTTGSGITHASEIIKRLKYKRGSLAGLSWLFTGGKTASTTTSQDQFCYLGQIRQFGLELIACDAFSSAFSKVSTMSFANRFESLRSSAFSGVLVWTIGESTSKSIRFQTKTDYMDGAWENFIQLQNHFFFRNLNVEG